MYKNCKLILTNCYYKSITNTLALQVNKKHVRTLVVMFVTATLILIIGTACIAWWQGIEMLQTLKILGNFCLYFTDQNWISKTVYYIRCVMVCKIGFTIWNSKIVLLRTSAVVTYYIKLFRTGADRQNGVLMSLLFLVAKTIS